MDYKISLDKIKQSHLRDVLAELEHELRDLGMDCYLIGALARDIWMTGVHGIQQQRATKDVDLAVLIPTKERYLQLKDRLIGNGHFTEVRNNPFKLVHSSKTEIDVLPFGGLDREGNVMLAGAGFTSLTIEGFFEVYESATESVELSGHEFRVCTLPGIVILKLIAYDDRPDMRSKDVQDIVAIIENYFNIASVDLFSKHFDLLQKLDSEFDTFCIGAHLLGRHMKPILSRSELLTLRITKILQSAIESQQDSKLAELMTRDMIGSLEEAKTILKELLAGINDIPLEHTSK
jgi:predicted nucleotidyltransferase